MRIDKLWLYFLPILFLPNLGFFDGNTSVGEIKVCDVLIFPYIFLVSLDFFRPNKKQIINLFKPLFIGLLTTIFIGSFLIYLFYNYKSNNPMITSLVKSFKFAVYSFAGYLSVRCIQTTEKKEQYYYSVLWSAFVLGFSLFFADQLSDTNSGISIEYNAQSCYLSILLTTIIIKFQYTKQYTRWKLQSYFLLPIVFIGFFLSQGRGGWLALLLGLVIFIQKTGISKTAIQIIIGGTVLFFVIYFNFEGFSTQIDRLLLLDEDYAKRMQSYGVKTAAGVEDGARLETWIHEFPKFTNAPLLGTGLFHRGGYSGLWSTGSHNFWIQMLLETGIIGFSFFVAIFYKVWSYNKLIKYKYKMGYHIVLSNMIVIIFNGMGGEYFYGGMGIMSFFLAFTPILSTTIDENQDE